jgi:DNA gyrase subunit A
MPCEDISVLGRITSGVKLMNLSEDARVASIEKVRQAEEAEKAAEEEASEEAETESEAEMTEDVLENAEDVPEEE